MTQPVSASTTALTLFDDGPPLPVDAVGLSGPIDPAAALAALPRLRRFGGAVRWIQGDLVLAVIENDLSRLWEARQILEGMDLDDQPSLQKSIAVAMRIPHHRRRPGLSWSHHRAVAGLTDETGASDTVLQDRWLDEAEERRLTVHDLEAEISASLADDDVQEPLIDPPAPPWTKSHGAAVSELDRAFGADAVVVVVHRDGSVTVPTADIADALAGLA